ncbi:MAG: tetratricopeptide repeat protein, partial [Abitibacteriaceae bacterium]|nr:tetratricopeptide repeat protein [Abditibacteriaceae bacterium]
AIALEVLKRLPDAERWLRQAQTSSPKDPRVPLLLGRVLGMRGKTEAAAVVLARGAQQFPDVIELHTLLSDVRWAQGDKDGAIAALRTAVPHVPASSGGGVPLARLHVAIGRLYAMRGQWPAAAREWRDATKLQPHDADVHGLLAEALWRSGDRAGTAAQLKQVLAIDPKRHDARHRLAKALADLGRYNEAQKEYAAYLKAKPNDVGAMVQQAALYEHQDDIPRAIESWNRVSTVWPENPLPALQRARLLRKSGNDTEALAQYRYALQIAPNDPQALSGAATLEEKSGQEMRALTHLRTLASQQPDNEAVYAALLRVSEQKQQLPATLNFLKQQLSKNPHHRAAYAALLDGYAKSGDADAGRTVVKDFMARYPKLTAPRMALDAFDLARAKKQLADLRRAKPVLTPASATPAAAPLPTPIPNTTATTPSETAPSKDDAAKPDSNLAPAEGEPSEHPPESKQ